MPIARYQMPDGRIGRFEVPDGTTPEQAQALISSFLQNKREPIDVEAAGQKARDDFWNSLSSYDAGVAGAGKEVVGMAKGAGQLLRGVMPDSWADKIGLPTEQDIDLFKQKTRALSDRTAGKVGQILGGAAAAVPAAFIPGANTVLGSSLIGTGIGALQPTGENDSRLANMAVGTAGGAAGQLLGRALPSASKSIMDPFFERGQQRGAAEAMARSSGMTPQALAAALRSGNRQIVPGSVPSAAEATMNPGVASLELAAKADPTVKALLQNQQLQNMAARVNVLDDLAKTPIVRDQLRGVRGMMSEPLYQKAQQEGLDQAAAVQLAPRIQELLGKLPSGTLEKAKDLARQAGISLDDPAGSVQGLQYLRWAIGDRLKGSGQMGALQGEERRLATQTLNELNSLTEQLSPTFAQANKAFSTWSRPINSAEVAQALKDKLVPSLMDFGDVVPTRVRAQSFTDALRNAPATIKSATGQANRELGDVMTSVDAGRLTDIAKDLSRRASAEDLAKTVGSTTAQNLAARQAMRRIAGPIGMPESWGEGALLMSTVGRPLSWAYGKFAEPGFQQELARALANPEYAAQLLQKTQGRIPPGMERAYMDLLTAASAGAPSGYFAQ